MLRAKCSKSRNPHTLATVSITSAGLIARLTIAVWGVGGPTTTGTHVEILEHGPGSSDSHECWCRACGMAFPVITPAHLFARAKAGEHYVQFTAEGMHRDPIGVLDRRAQRNV